MMLGVVWLWSRVYCRVEVVVVITTNSKGEDLEGNVCIRRGEAIVVSSNSFYSWSFKNHELCHTRVGRPVGLYRCLFYVVGRVTDSSLRRVVSCGVYSSVLSFYTSH